MLKFLSNLFKNSNDNEHQSLINAIGNQVDSVGTDSDDVKTQMQIATATDEWLDYWAGWFGLVREAGELDADFRQRVIGCMADKCTIPALTDAAKRILGQDTIVTIYEPYNDIRYFNRSAFSQTGRFEDGDYYRVGVIDLQVNKPITQELQDVINSMVAGGVSCKFTYTV